MTPLENLANYLGLRDRPADGLARESVRYALARDPAAQPLARDPGAPPSDPCTVWTLPAALGHATAHLDAPWWQPDPDGTLVHTVPGIEMDSDIPLDIVAWEPRAPGRMYRRTGYARHLGDMTGGGPLLLHPHAASWVEAGGIGVVIIDWKHYAQRLRMGGRPIRCVGEKFTAFVKKQLEDATPRMPVVSMAREGKR